MVPISRNDEFVNKKIDEGDVLRFQTLLAEGKQAYISEKFKEAEIKLSEAAELSVNIYGYFAAQTFDPHLYYGKTLLELARLEDSVFSNALHGIGTVDGEACKNTEKNEDLEELEALTEEEGAEIKEKVGNALEENAEALEDKIACCQIDSSNTLEKIKEENGEKRANVEAEKTDTYMAVEDDRSSVEKKQTRNDCIVRSGKDEGETVDYKEDRSKIEENRKKDGNVKNKEEVRDEDEDDNEDDKLDEDDKDGVSENSDSKDGSSDAEDVEYLQLAWENLEVARTICDKHLEEEGWKERKVEVLLDLADCSTDAENYKQAIDDIDACILLAESIFGETDRCVAQAYFVKGRTHNLAKDFGNAAKVLGKSKEILQTRLAKLEAQLLHESLENAKKIRMEIDELKSLLPEIQIKIDDSLESARTYIKETVVPDDEKDLSVKSSIKEMPVDDVNNLVRKKLKRPAEEKADRERKKYKNDGNPENAAFDSSA